jgi:hypothetical protein
MLIKFVSETQRLYGIENMSYNVHQLCHLVQSVRNSGPLWRTSAFAFESNNQQLLQMFNGKVHVAEQLANTFTTLILIKELSNSSNCSTDSGTNATVQQCIDKWLNGYPLANCALRVNENTVAIGFKQERILTQRELNIVRALFPNFSVHCFTYERTIIRNKTFCTEQYGVNLKTHSYSVVMHNNCFARIVSFVVDPETNEMVVFCKRYEKSNRPSPFRNMISKTLVNSQHHVILNSDTFIVTKPCDIVSKIVFLGTLSKNEFVVSLQPNTIECD